MNDPRGDVPHFLRVVRALARVSGPTVPLAVFVTMVSSCANTCKEGFTVMEDAGDVGAGEVGAGGVGAGGAAGEGRRRGESPGGGGGGQGGQGSGGGHGGASATDGSTGGSGGDLGAEDVPDAG